jgi:hypothetical protein
MAGDSYLDRNRAANASMGKKAKAVRAEQRRVANIVANKVGEAIGFVTNGPEHTQGYNQLGVLGSKGFVKAFSNASLQVGKAFHKDLGAGFTRSSIRAFTDNINKSASSSVASPVGDAVRKAVGNQTYEVWRRGMAAKVGQLGSKEFTLNPAEARGLTGSNSKVPSVRLKQNIETGIVNRSDSVKLFPYDRSKLKSK